MTSRRGMSEKRKHWTFTLDQRAEFVLAGLRGDRPVRDVCRETVSVSLM